LRQVQLRFAYELSHYGLHYHFFHLTSVGCRSSLKDSGFGIQMHSTGLIAPAYSLLTRLYCRSW